MIIEDIIRAYIIGIPCTFIIYWLVTYYELQTLKKPLDYVWSGWSVTWKIPICWPIFFIVFAIMFAKKAKQFIFRGHDQKATK